MRVCLPSVWAHRRKKDRNKGRYGPLNKAPFKRALLKDPYFLSFLFLISEEKFQVSDLVDAGPIKLAQTWLRWSQDGSKRPEGAQYASLLGTVTCDIYIHITFCKHDACT